MEERTTKTQNVLGLSDKGSTVNLGFKAYGVSKFPVFLILLKL